MSYVIEPQARQRGPTRPQQMLRLPTPADMLAAWERGQPEGPVERGLTLLGLASPHESIEQLATLSIGERDRRLLALREAMFGERLVGLVACSQCGEQLELDVPVSGLLVEEPDRVETMLALQEGGFDIRLRLPDSYDLQEAVAAEHSGDSAPDRSGSAAVRALIERCILSARRDDLEVGADALPTALLEQAAERITCADPQADLQLSLTCVACSARCQVSFDIVSFLWTELDGWAEQMLSEIHALACAYGWSEREILSLGPVRRDAYLRMVYE